MNYTWKILDITSVNDIVTEAKYLLSATDGENTVETEGNWIFEVTSVNIAFKDLLPSDVFNWIENDPRQDQVIALKSNLAKQLENLKQEKPKMPWIKPTFSVQL